MEKPRVIVLEPGVDGEALAELGPDRANWQVRRERWARLERAMESVLSAPRTVPIEVGSWWQERRRDPLPPCETSTEVDEMFRMDGRARRIVRVTKVDYRFVYFYIARSTHRKRMWRNHFRARFRRIEG